MNIATIYRNYHIMPSLQLHMFRVAGVADVLSEHITMPVEKEYIISACLLHDMGNILKFDLHVFPEFLEPEGFEYWAQVQKQYKKKYGTDENKATLAIAREIGVNERTCELIESIGFIKAPQNCKNNDFSAKICMYADIRVKPNGVTSMKDRLSDGKKRYEVHKSEKSNAFFDEMAAHIAQIEGQIFSHIEFTPTYITEKSISPAIEKLQNFIVT